MKNQIIFEARNGPAGRIKPALAALALLVGAATPALADDDHGGQPAYTFTTFDVPFAAPPSEIDGGASCYGINNVC